MFSDVAVRGITRAVALLAIGILATAVVVLYFFPSETDRHFAWTIQPQMTALAIGAGYGGGIYFFARLALNGEWRPVSAAIPGIWLFTVAVLIATLLHLDRFHHGHPAFYLWIGAYGLLPFLIPVVWWLNERVADSRGRDAPGRPEVPRALRVAAAVVSLPVLSVALVLFAVPETVATIWPWTLTPLTGRVVAAFYLLGGAIALTLATRRLWDDWRIPIHGELIGYALLALALPRALPDLRADNPLAWVFMAVTVSAVVVLAGLIAYMERSTGTSLRAGSIGR